MREQARMYKEREQLTSHLLRLSETSSEQVSEVDAAILCDLGGGVLRFAEAIFPGVEVDRVYAEKYKREPQGRGAHFDIYEAVVDPNLPWVGVYNLSGVVKATLAKLPDPLAKTYFDTFTGPSKEAYEARRDFSNTALLDEKTLIFEGILKAGRGVVLLQKDGGPHMIHDIVPEDTSQPGEFIKLVCPAENVSKRAVEIFHMRPLDEMITQVLSEASLETANKVIAHK